jgi:hypothetical protein
VRDTEIRTDMMIPKNMGNLLAVASLEYPCIYAQNQHSYLYQHNISFLAKCVSSCLYKNPHVPFPLERQSQADLARCQRYGAA